jgi:hypothetical protein
MSGLITSALSAGTWPAPEIATRCRNTCSLRITLVLAIGVANGTKDSGHALAPESEPIYGPCLCPCSVSPVDRGHPLGGIDDAKDSMERSGCRTARGRSRWVLKRQWQRQQHCWGYLQEGRHLPAPFGDKRGPVPEHVQWVTAVQAQRHAIRRREDTQRMSEHSRLRQLQRVHQHLARGRIRGR